MTVFDFLSFANVAAGKGAPSLCTLVHDKRNVRIEKMRAGFGNDSGGQHILTWPFPPRQASLWSITRGLALRRGQLKCDDTRAETRILLSAKRTSTFKSAGASVQSTTGSRGVRISGSNAGYTMFRGSVKGTGYPLYLNRCGRQFSRLQAAEVCASAVVMLDTPCSEVVWRVLATHYKERYSESNTTCEYFIYKV